MEGINLRKASLQNANLSGLNLSDADLTDAKLQGARLGGTDLRGASLRQANLTGASLAGASIKNADLVGAVLVGADLTSTEPWGAILYERSELDPVGDSSPAKVVGSVGELVETASRLTQRHTPSPERADAGAPILYFRGEAFHQWELRPSSARAPKPGEPDIRGREGEMLRDLMSRRPAEFSRMTSALSQWVLAQHHGLKTRLLDLTRNPLVALFSACERSAAEQESSGDDGVLHAFVVPRDMIKSFDSDSVSVITNFARLPLFDQEVLLGKREQDVTEDMGEPRTTSSIEFSSRYGEVLTRLYHYIGREKPHFRERVDPRDLYRVLVVEPEQSVERVRAQSGAFLLSALHQRFEPAHIRDWNRDTPVYRHHKFIVPAGCKQDIQGELQLLNVTRETLFPGLDEATQAVMQRHRG